MDKKKYTFFQKMISSFSRTNTRWYYATKVERLLMTFEDLSEEEKKEFLEKIKNL